MHPLMRSVVLRMTRATPFQINPQRNRPGRQPTKAQNSKHAGEGRAVVAADRLWQPGSLKESLKTLPHLFRAGALHCTQFQYVATVLIAHCQRFAPLAPASPPALKIHCPHFVRRCSTLAAAQAPCLSRAPPLPPLLCQSHSFQHPFERALTGHLSMTTQIQFPNLARSPAQMCQLQAHYLAQLFLRQLLRSVSRTARLFFHPAHPVAQKALLPFVSGLCADPILLAQRPKVQRLHRSQGKLNSLFHRFCFLPRHRAPFSSSLPQNSVTYVLNLLCYLSPEPAPTTLAGRHTAPLRAWRCTKRDSRNANY